MFGQRSNDSLRHSVLSQSDQQHSYCIQIYSVYYFISKEASSHTVYCHIQYTLIYFLVYTTPGQLTLVDFSTNLQLCLLPPRSKLTQIVVDVSAGPYKDRTVMFLGSDDGRVLKVLASTHPNDSFGSKLLEDIDVYNPSK